MNRSCYNCGIILKYQSIKTFNRANRFNSPCRRCGILLKYKSSPRVTKFPRTCPKCKKTVYHKNKKSCDTSIRLNSLCKKCCQEVRKEFKITKQKTCSSCGFKGSAKFFVGKKMRISKCISCRRKYSREYYQMEKEKFPTRVREKFRKKHLWDRYKMTLSDFKKLFNKQDKKCAICLKKLKRNKTHVDHDHATGKVRGILCKSCNFGLGYFLDNTNILHSAMEYLEKYG